MIRRLRVGHRRTFGLLAVLLPIGFVAAIAARPEFPVSKTLPSELLGSRDQSLMVSGAIAHAPDVLVYLVAGEFSGDSLPDEALLLGSFGGPRSKLSVPDDVEGEHTLVYYSLAHGEVVLATKY